MKYMYTRKYALSGNIYTYYLSQRETLLRPFSLYMGNRYVKPLDAPYGPSDNIRRYISSSHRRKSNEENATFYVLYRSTFLVEIGRFGLEGKIALLGIEQRNQAVAN